MLLQDNAMVEATGLGVTQIHPPLGLGSLESQCILQAPGWHLTQASDRIDAATLQLATMGLQPRETAASVGLGSSGERKGSLISVATVYGPNTLTLES